MRKIIIGIIAICLIGIIGYFLIPTGNTDGKEKYSSALNAVPCNAAFIIRTANPTNAWKNFEDSRIGTALGDFEISKQLDSLFSKLDSISNTVNGLQKIFDANSSFIAGIVSSATTTDLLYAVELKEFEQENLNKVFTSFFGKNIESKIYEETSITSYQSGKSKIFTCTVGNVLIASSSSIIAEQSIRQIKSGVSLVSDVNFKKLIKTADKALDANLFINYAEIGKVLSTFSSEQLSPVSHLKNFGIWSEVDLNIKNNGLMLNGFSILNDSAFHYLNSFIDEEPQTMLVSSVLPENSGLLLYLSFNSFNSYYKKFESYLGQQQTLYKHQKNILNINKKYNFTVEGDFFPWIGNEICLFATEGDSKSINQSFALAIRTTDIQKAKQGLEEIIASTKNNYKADYQNFEIRNLGLTNFLELTLGQQFKFVNKTFYTTIEDYVIFSNSESNLKHTINSYLRGKTLVKNIAFNQFYEKFNNQSNFFFYYNFKKNQPLLAKFVSESTLSNLNDQKDSLDQLGALGIQINNQKKLFYTNLYIDYSTSSEAPTMSLIETKLDTSYSTKPWVVVNHYTQEKEILIQDNKNKLYLINNVGKILWKRQLSSRIIGDIVQVDRYKNNKLQYTFNTNSLFHQIDRNGKDVSGYPVSLKNPATQGVSVIDYDRSKNYRILICQGKDITNYDINGKKLNGWEFKASGSNIAIQPQLLQINGKDYILVADVSGKARVLNRKGEDRINLSIQLPTASENHFIWKNNTISNSGFLATDSVGTVHFVKLSDELETFSLGSLPKEFKLFYKDIDGDHTMDFLVRAENYLKAFKTNKEIIFSIEDIEAQTSYPIETLQLGKTQFISFISDKIQNKCFAYKSDSELFNGFPIDGSTPVLIEDLNGDGTPNLIIGDKIGSVYIYSIIE